MKRVFLLNILVFCLLKLGVSQTITVSPDVICEGENSYIGTDTNLNYVNIGDIICVGNSAHDTIIVRPEAWSRYSSTYTALSVVFYVDQTGKHGWAVKAGTYDSKKWKGTAALANLDCIDNKGVNRTALVDRNGYSNTACIRSNIADSPLLSVLPVPFYLPAIGQLNYLFAQIEQVNSILFEKLSMSRIPTTTGTTTIKNWWSSTEFDGTATTSKTYALSLNPVKGKVENKAKTTQLYVLPTMNF